MLKSFKQYIQEKITPIVFHKTSVVNAIKILATNKFRLSAVIGTKSEEEQNKGKFYFLSTARTPNSSFFNKFPTTGDLYFELDGDKFNERYKGFPIDYWGDSFSDREMEDRIVSDDQIIPNAKSYINSIHVYYATTKPVEKSLLSRLMDGEEGKDLGSEEVTIDRNQLKYFEKLYSLAKKNNIPIYFYDDEKAFFNRNAKKTVEPLEVFKKEGTFKDEEPKTYPRPRRKHFLSEWLELIKTPIDQSQFNSQDEYTGYLKQKLDKRAYRLVSDIMYGSYMDDLKRSLDADVHNMKSDENISKFIDAMKENKLRTLDDVINFLVDKYKWKE